MLFNYNPADIPKNKTYITESGSNYSLDSEGRFHGRDSIEGVKPVLVAGLGQKHEMAIDSSFDYVDRNALGDLIKKFGKKPKKNRYLVMLLSTEDMEKTGRIGFKSSPLEKIK